MEENFDEKTIANNKFIEWWRFQYQEISDIYQDKILRGCAKCAFIAGFNEVIKVNEKQTEEEG